MVGVYRCEWDICTLLLRQISADLTLMPRSKGSLDSIPPRSWFCRTALLLLAAALLAGCSRRPDAQTAFDHAAETLKHGNAAEAADEAQKGYDEFRNSSPKWSWEFAILRARALYRLGKYEEALKSLSSVPTSPPLQR